MDESQRPGKRIPVSQVFPLALQHLTLAKTILKKRAELDPTCGGWANLLFRSIDLALHSIQAWENPKYLEAKLAAWERFALLCPRCDYVFKAARTVTTPVACPECNDVFLVGSDDLPQQDQPAATGDA